ncbi:AcrR family transcriptional regulator [Nakamurella sp. UYEF19]|uniref:TetR/AcrR family transcriptional regulator n=1 Tax=Nakamurella sp. UYEF19 TaxID=1756392 RepID=UPI00339AB154
MPPRIPNDPRPLQPRSLVTQQQVLDAAVTALIEHGYAGATTVVIQQLAGVTRGRLLHQFPARDQLLIAAVQHLAIARVEATRERTTWPEDPGSRIDAAIEEMWSTYQQGLFWASTELWLASRYNDDLRQALLPAERLLGEKIRTATDLMFGRELTAREGYTAMRELVNTSMRGVALTYSFDRRKAGTDGHLPIWKATARGRLLAEYVDGVVDADGHDGKG